MNTTDFSYTSNIENKNETQYAKHGGAFV